MNENSKRKNTERKTSPFQCSKKHITSEQKEYPECGVRSEQGIHMESIYVWADYVNYLAMHQASQLDFFVFS